jgi:hypothetical protein
VRDERSGPSAEYLGSVGSVALGTVAVGVRVVGTVARPALGAAAAVFRLGARVARGGPGERVVVDLVARGDEVRARLEQAFVDGLRRFLPSAVEAVLAMIDLTGIVRRNVDLDVIARDIDVDAVVARADIDAVVARADLDAVLARVDLDVILDRLDLDAIVARVDLDLVTARLDLDAIAKRLDTNAVVARVDLDAIIARLDLAGIARDVLDAIDLPEILRESTGAVSSEAVRGLRAEGVQADDAVTRFVARMLRRPDPGQQPVAP